MNYTNQRYNNIKESTPGYLIYTSSGSCVSWKAKTINAEIAVCKEQDYVTCKKICLLFSLFMRKPKHMVYLGTMNRESDCTGVPSVKGSGCVCRISRRAARQGSQSRGRECLTSTRQWTLLWYVFLSLTEPIQVIILKHHFWPVRPARGTKKNFCWTQQNQHQVKLK